MVENSTFQPEKSLFFTLFCFEEREPSLFMATRVRIALKTFAVVRFLVSNQRLTVHVLIFDFIV